MNDALCNIFLLNQALTLLPNKIPKEVNELATILKDDHECLSDGFFNEQKGKPDSTHRGDG